MAKLEIELRPDEEQRLTEAAQRQGLSLLTYARQRLLDDTIIMPGSAADVLVRWQTRGLAGAWADRTDIRDSADYARRLRQRAQFCPAEESEPPQSSLTWPPPPEVVTIPECAVQDKRLLTPYPWLDILIGLVIGIVSWPVMIVGHRYLIIRLEPAPRSVAEFFLAATISLVLQLVIYLALRRRYSQLSTAFVISGYLVSIPLFCALLFGMLLGPPSP